MALPATLTFSGGTGPNFEVELASSSADTTPIVATPINNITFYALDESLVRTGFSFSFTPGSDQVPSATQDTPYIPSFYEYMNWRTGDDARHPISKGTNPSTGEYSFDLWPFLDANGNTTSSFIEQVNENDYTWNDWAGGAFNTLNLNPNKHTVFYDYGTPFALGWKLGGQVVITLAS